MTINPEIKAGLTRHFQRYSHDHRAALQANPRMHHRQRESVGEYFWTHDAVPGRAFDTRKQAVAAASEAMNMSSYNA